ILARGRVAWAGPWHRQRSAGNLSLPSSGVFPRVCLSLIRYGARGVFGRRPFLGFWVRGLLAREVSARTIVFADHVEQEMQVAAVGSAFRRLGSMGSPHLAQVPYVPSDIRFRAASI